MKNPDPSGKQEAVIVQSRARLRVGLLSLVAIVLLGMTLGIFQEPQPVSQPSDVVNVHGSGNSTDSASAVISQGPAMPKQSREGLTIEVCGLGRFRADTDLGSIRKVHASAMRAAKEANIESLLAGAEPASRAAGLVMRMAETAQRGLEGRLATAETCSTTGKKPSSAEMPETCVVPPPDGDAIVAQVRQGFAPWAEKLAAVAATSSDPRMFAQAVRACEGQPTLQACNAVIAERWARLEPGNLVPWIRILNNARARQDTAGVNEALHQMSVAQYASTYELFAWTKLAAQADAGTDLQRLGSTEQMASVHLLPSLEIGGLFAECKKPSIADANRRQLCDRIASAMVKQSDSYALATFGGGIGQHVGWSNHKLAAIRAERLAVQQAHAESMSALFDPEGAQKLDCQSVARLQSYYSFSGQWGELAAGRRLAKANGIDVAAKAQSMLDEESRRLEQAALPAQMSR